jgi:5-methylcytosine-specific restriction enzyme subunit McrC
LIRTPCGTRIEVLPKTLEDHEHAESTRQWLLRMIATLPQWREVLLDSASTRAVSLPLLEVFIGSFLKSVNRLVKRGIRHEYVAQRGNERFLRGRLLIPEHLRANLARRDRFYVEHDAYLMNRPANRLLRTALERVLRWSSHPAHLRLCRELLFTLGEAPISRDIRADLARSERGRMMTGYRVPLAWARLILSTMTPLTTAGRSEALSLVFPMDYLFESYVAAKLAPLFRSPLRLRSQVGGQNLVHHRGARWFRLQPDLAVTRRGRVRTVMDTKWKLIDGSKANGTDKYDLSQGDFYQLYAYGQKYLGGDGRLLLIYPKTPRFSEPLPRFDFDAQLSLWVVPFDVPKGCLVSEGLGFSISLEGSETASAV